MKFRRKPNVIDAITVQMALIFANGDWNKLPDWLREAYENGGIVFLADSINIKTLEGTMTGNKGDWIVRGIEGELYPCKPDIFEKNHEPVEEPKP